MTLPRKRRKIKTQAIGILQSKDFICADWGAFAPWLSLTRSSGKNTLPMFTEGDENEAGGMGSLDPGERGGHS